MNNYSSFDDIGAYKSYEQNIVNNYVNIDSCPMNTTQVGCINYECDGIISKNTCAGNLYCTKFICNKK